MKSFELKQKLQKIIDWAVDKEITPSISLFAGSGIKPNCENIVIHKVFDALNKTKTSAETIYDLASLTKILGSSTAIARACALGLINIEERPFKSWPEVSIKKILSHTSGLPAHVKFYELASLKDASPLNKKAAMLNELFKIKPSGDNNFLYSDLGFIALGDLLETRFKKPLDLIFQENAQIFANNCCFGHFPERVNDDNAQALGGLAGHAGLFARLLDVANAGRYFLRCLKNPGNATEEFLSYFIKNHLGFHKPSNRGSINDFSPRSFGHFGYTGTSLWIDPKAHKDGLVVVLLTNRLAGSNPDLIFDLRKKIHQSIINHQNF